MSEEDTLQFLENELSLAYAERDDLRRQNEELREALAKEGVCHRSSNACIHIIEKEKCDQAREIARLKEQLAAAQSALTAEQARREQMRAACRVTFDRLNKHGEWDDGCFYYGGTSASELQEPYNALQVALALTPAPGDALNAEMEKGGA